MVMQQTSSDILRQEILEQSKAESESVLVEARKEETRMLNQARKEADAAREKILKAAHAQAMAIQKKILSNVQLEIKKHKLSAREQIFKRIIQAVKDKLDDYRNDPDYLSFLQVSLFEAINVLQEDSVILQVGEIERKILDGAQLKNMMKNYQKHYAQAVEISFSKSPLDEGGVLVMTKDGRKRYDNSFSAQMRRHEDIMRLSILKNVFG